MKNKELKRIEYIYVYIKNQIKLCETKQASTKETAENIKLLLNKLKSLLEEYNSKAERGELSFVSDALIECYKIAINFDNDKVFVTEEDENNFLNQIRGTIDALENEKMNVLTAYILLFIIYNNNTTSINENIQNKEKTKTIGALSLA